MTKREYLKQSLKKDYDCIPDDPRAIDFYYRAVKDYGMSLMDADNYAWLNTLFGYDIGVEHARGIDGWFYEQDMDVKELGAESKDILQDICESELGYSLDFSRFAIKTPGYCVYPEQKEGSL